MCIRNNWTKTEVEEIYNRPLLDLVREASQIHAENHNPNEIKVSTLISVKTGACVEDCAYCAQSSRYKTGVEPHRFMSVQDAVDCAKRAKENGATRVCLSASWRKVNEDQYFNDLIEMAKEIRKMDLQVCCTLGMIDKEKVAKLKDAGFTAYNHNLDTSENFYPEIISTRNYKDRLDTINELIDAEMPFCSGGIIGLGETDNDRIDLLHTLSTQKVHPYSTPFNALVPIPGTPLENNKVVSVFEMVRMIAVARILMPKTIICLAAGRMMISDEGQAMCYLAGANSVFIGEKLLTTPSPDVNSDMTLFNTLGLKMMQN
ncbi:MAG: biotin synthase BioB [Bacteroidota bacterium]